MQQHVKNKGPQIELSHVVQTQTGEDLCVVVHELAQPLTSISVYIWGCIHQLTTGTPEKEAILQVMNKIMKDIERAEQIILRINNLNN